MNGYPTMSAFAEVTQRSAGRSRRLYVCFFLLFFLLFPSQEIILSFSLYIGFTISRYTSFIYKRNKNLLMNCLYIYIYIYIYIYMYIFMYTHIYTYIYVYIYIRKCVCVSVYLFNLSIRAGCDTRSVFKWCLPGLIKIFPSHRQVVIPRLKLEGR